MDKGIYLEEYDKCRFCTRYSSYTICTSVNMCKEHENFKPSKNKIIDKAKSTGLSVTDIIALINLEE